MRTDILFIIGFVLVIAAISITPVSAVTIGSVDYTYGVYTEGEDFSLIPAVEPKSAVDTLGTYQIQSDGAQILTLNRRPLVGYPGTSVIIEISGLFVSAEQVVTTDLKNLKIILNGQEIDGLTLPVTGRANLRISGDIPYESDMDVAIRIIQIPGADRDTNAKFILYTTNAERSYARESLYTLNEQVARGEMGVSGADLQKAVDEYVSGRFAVSAAQSQITLEKWDIRQDGMIVGLIIGGVIALILCILGFFVGQKIGVKRAERPDLYTLEKIILGFYDIQNEAMHGETGLTKECGGYLQKAFEFNSKRAEAIVSMGDNFDFSTINTRGDLKPSLFQAYYEKVRYGDGTKFDRGIKRIGECLKFQGSMVKEDEKKKSNLLSGIRR